MIGVIFRTSVSSAQQGAYFAGFWGDGSRQYWLVRTPASFGWIRNGRLVPLPDQDSAPDVAAAVAW